MVGLYYSASILAGRAPYVSPPRKSELAETSNSVTTVGQSGNDIQINGAGPLKPLSAIL